MNLEQEGFSIINAFLRFSELGAEWVMWLLLGLGLVMIILFFERLVLFRKTKIDAPSMARQFVTALDADDFEQAKQVVARGVAMEERVLADVLEVAPRGPQVAEQILQSGIVRERQRYERFLAYFGTIGNNAPFIGLLGTIIGIIVAFRELGENPKGGLEVVGPGIAEALVATAVGLLVAIPAVVVFNLFKGQVKTRVGNTDFLARIVMAWIQQRDLESGAPADASSDGDS